MKIKKFLEKLASDTPTPGGGSAAALSGALSASLVAMVEGLPIKRGSPKARDGGDKKENFNDRAEATGDRRGCRIL